MLTNSSKVSTLNTEINTLNSLITAENPNYDEVTKQRITVDEALKAVNAEITETRINELLAMEKVAMFNEFIDNRFIMLAKLSEGENGTFTTIETQKQLCFAQLEKANGKPLAKSYEVLTALFMDNLYRLIKDDLKVKNINAKNMPSLNKDFMKHRKEYKFDSTSLTSLEKQLNTILSFLLPEEIDIKAVKADVKYLQYALTRIKNGTLTVMHERTFVNEIFTMLYFRKNKIAYQFQTKMDCHKSNN